MFETALKLVLDVETPRLTNDPTDPGGLTKYGISQRAFPTEDIAAMTLERASELYRKCYWDTCRCDELPGPIAIIVFDMAVNQGTNIAAKILQTVTASNVDGVIGPHTIQAANTLPILHLIFELTARRIWRYGIGPDFPTNGLGWTRRALEALFLAQENI